MKYRLIRDPRGFYKTVPVMSLEKFAGVINFESIHKRWIQEMRMRYTPRRQLFIRGDNI